MRRIASRDNPAYRDLLLLATSTRERRRRSASLVEGIHLCEAFLDRHGDPLQAVVSDSSAGHPEVQGLLARLGGDPLHLSDALFRSISGVEHGVGIAFVVDTPRPALPMEIDADCVYLDGLQDPGNVGTILRTCAAAGVRRVATAPGTAWCWSPKVLRAGMGAHFLLDLHESVGWDEFAARLRVPVFGATADGARPIYSVDLRPPCAWVFGREGEGLSAAVLEAVGLRVSIPQDAAVESLNVGVAAAVCLYEQLRQRRFASGG
jgi:TrmH family RNA methyltransferase